MKAEQVDQALYQKFVTEQKRLVFWHDANGEFADYIEAGLSESLPQVNILRPDQTGGFSAKLQLERHDPTGQYLIYTQGEKPTVDQDFLLDIRHYSAEFHADIASIWLQELGLTHLYLREHLKARATFLNSQDRRRKLQRLVTATDDVVSLDQKMIAVVVNAPEATPFTILRSLCHGHLQGENFDLTAPPDSIQTLEKMNLAEAFWAMMESEFGYQSDSPSLGNLLRRLFISELLDQLPAETTIAAVYHYALPPSNRRNAKVFLTQWRDSHSTNTSYNATAQAIATELDIKEHLQDLSLTTLGEIFTFWEVEALLLSGLKERILQARQAIDAQELSDLARRRQTGYWLANATPEGPKSYAIAQAYEALICAGELFTLPAINAMGLIWDSPQEAIASYCSELYRYDQLYRQFVTAARYSQNQGWDLLKSLEAEVENFYNYGFIQPLGLAMDNLLDGGFLQCWSIPGYHCQQDFYRQVIGKYLAQSDRKRAFVIISDAFRYEAAQELVTTLNGKYRLAADLSSLLGVLPSYTSLGMASLLPHDSLSYDANGEVLADGQPTKSTGDRHAQLETMGGMACLAKDLLQMKQEEARQFTEGKKVIYIYHDVIDDRLDGDNKESGTLDAVTDCIRELAELAQFCVNRLNASKVWITADHGFLFQQSQPDATSKSSLSQKPSGTIKANKRYLLGTNLGEVPEVHHGSTVQTAGMAKGLEFWLPRAANRFHFVGGSRFVHGGAMPQEIVIPLVTVTQLRGQQAAQSKVEKVSLQVLGNRFKVTTPKYRFEFIQTEAIGVRRQPITVKVAIYEGNNPVTAIETLTFDSSSDNIGDRTKSVLLTLGSGPFHPSNPYRLVVRDTETDGEVLGVPVIIDRSFEDDF
jgi:uncharacterized protein (TIGR02687 family)